MSQAGQSSMLRSLGAVLAGVAAIVVLSLGTDVVLHVLGVYPPWDQTMSDQLALLATAYRTLYAVVGSYITARLAPNRPLQHALVIGLIGIVLNAGAAIATWNHAPPYGPHWYPVVLIVISLPCAWVGGKLVRTQTN